MYVQTARRAILSAEKKSRFLAPLLKVLNFHPDACGASCEKLRYYDHDGEKHGGFRCASGECLTPAAKCDGEKDCGDGSDETTEECGDDCEGIPQGGGFKCEDGRQCIRAERICDAAVHCDDGSDENTNSCGKG